MKAWVISILSFEAIKGHPDTEGEVVVGLVPARRTVSFIKSYIATLVSVLRTSLDEQSSEVAYVKPSHKHVVSIHSDVFVSYFDHPYLFKGQKSDVISFRTVGYVSWIKWKGMNYTRFEQDPVTHHLKKIEEVNPPLSEAPQANFGLSNWYSFANTIGR